MVEAPIAPGQRMFSQRGAMLAYRGEVSFTPSIIGGQGGVIGDDRAPGRQRGTPR